MKRLWPFLAALAAALAFSCASADVLDLPADTAAIAGEAFAGNAHIFGVTLPEGLREIGGRAFAGCGIEAVYLPDSLEILARDAFDADVRIYVGPSCAAIPELEKWGREYTVIRLPDSIALEPGSARLRPGETAVPAVALRPRDADLPPVRWTSSDGAVASVSEEGRVTALAEGTAVIRAEAPGGLRAEMTVTVHEPVYRALLVANVHYGYETSRWNAGDIDRLKKMFASVTAPNGEPWRVTVKYDLSASMLREALETVFADTREGDVSLFHISSHGDVRAEGELAGRLKMPQNRRLTYVPYGTLKEWMDLYIRGEKVLFLEACSSGSSIDARAGAPFCAAGHYVLTSAGYMESCWSNNGNFNYFVQWLTEGVGTSGVMPADSDRDGALTLGELYAYISRVGDRFRIGSETDFAYQTACVYPKRSGFVLFLRGISP